MVAGDDPLQQLRDVHLPATPSWFPPAPGWWLLAALALVLVAYAISKLRRRRIHRAPFRSARAELARLRADVDSGRVGARDYADGASAVLKRLAVHVLGRTDTASLSGAAWLAFLDELSADGAFSRGPGAALGTARFAPEPRVEVDGLHRDVLNLVARLERRT